MQKILITGSSGTIGTRTFEKLIESGIEPTGLDKVENKWNTTVRSKTIIADLLIPEQLKKLPIDIDCILHLAANSRVYEQVRNPNLALENAMMTYNLLELARKNDIDQVILASSREVYGDIPENETVDEYGLRIENCGSPYSASKIWGEALMWSYAKSYGMKIAVVRLSNIYGMYDDSDRVIPLWIKCAINNKDVVIYGSNKVLDFLYIDDAVGAIIKVIHRFQEIKGETINIAFGRGHKLAYVAEKIKELTMSSSSIVIRNNRPGELSYCVPDVSKAKRLLGYEPQVKIDEGLRRAVNWYRHFYAGRN